MSAFLRTACSAAVTLAGSAWAADPAPTGSALSLLRQLDAGFVEVFEKVAPSVVVIDATKKPDAEERELREFDRFFEEKGPRGDLDEREWPLPSRSEGSGFIFRSDGYVLTNLHVVADAEKISVRLRDGRSFSGKVEARDERTDIAIVRIGARDLPAAQIGDSDAVRVGQLVCAIGAPFNQHFSFSVGWVSGKGRSKLLAPGSSDLLYEDYLQTDTFINPGNSGGPLFDVEGRVVGMNTLINGIGRGLAFAIPSNMFQEVAGQLIARGRVQRAWLGVRMDTLSERPDLQEEIAGIDRGVVVTGIEVPSPAYKSQLQPKDVIVAIDGRGVDAALELQKEVLKKKIGAKVQLKVWRGGKAIQVPVAMEELPEKLAVAADKRPGKLGVESRAESLGMSLRDARRTGAAVVAVVPGSPADRAALQTDDVITEIAGRPVRSAAAADEAIGDRLRASGKKPVVLKVERHAKQISVEITPKP